MVPGAPSGNADVDALERYTHMRTLTCSRYESRRSFLLAPSPRVYHNYTSYRCSFELFAFPEHTSQRNNNPFNELCRDPTDVLLHSKVCLCSALMLNEVNNTFLQVLTPRNHAMSWCQTASAQYTSAYHVCANFTCSRRFYSRSHLLPSARFISSSITPNTVISRINACLDACKDSHM